MAIPTSQRTQSYRVAQTRPKRSQMMKALCRYSHETWWKIIQESAGHAAKLNHGRDIALDTGKICLVQAVEPKLFLEGRRVEDTGDETFINTTGGAQNAESKHGKS
ncbi:unnamed protein product [Clonostachys rosea f. rosea IK726]|uniref:Uncharacterized protein n=2 Tax=Clonostachys rosea f. rosea IK726 TaxID=1349383 RepID=A0ACA9TMU4_BIOOC|nr:unnamed protein product [Clonostachys rosea f. rosea IK726]CAG9945906.1 unnamed protein product [Clonostachys rosea f. rosea IK726]